MGNDKTIDIIVQAKDEASATLKNVDNNISTMTKSILAMGAVIAFEYGKRAVTALKDLAKQALVLAGNLEASETAFKVMTGSAEEAGRIMQRIKDEAKRTPFEIQGLTDATLAMTAITKDGDEAIDIILDIGEAIAASGKGQAEFDRVVLNLQQIAATGKVTEMDLRQFANAIPNFYEILSKSTGKSLQQLKDDGELTFETFKKVFAEATEEGGIFFGMYEESGTNFNQMTSNMSDTWNTFLAEMAVESGLFDGVKSLMETITEMDLEPIIENLKTMSQVIEAIYLTMKDLVEGSMKAMGVNAKDMELAFKMAAGIIIVLLIAIGGAIAGIIVLIMGTIRAIRWVSDILADFIYTGIVLFNRLKQAVMNVGYSIASAFAGAMASVKNIIINSVNWVIGKINTVIGSVNSVSSKLGLGSISEIAHLAMGSENFRGGTAMVGENGPEIVNIPSGSQVLNAQDSAGGLESSFNNYGTINLNSASAVEAFKKEISMDLELADIGLI